MKKVLLKIATHTLILTLCMTQSAFAQTTSLASTAPILASSAEAAPVPETPTLAGDQTIDTASTTTPTHDPVLTSASASTSVVATPLHVDTLVLQGSAVTMQDATTTQLAVMSQILESTTNPELATSTDVTSTPLVTVSTSTPVTQSIDLLQAKGSVIPFPISNSDTSADIVGESIDTAPAPSEPIVQASIPEATQVLTRLPIANATVQPEFTFALTGKQIPTVRTTESKDGTAQKHETIAAPLTSTVDNTSGEVTVSGQCSNAYYVVLLFKNAEDYTNDPRSYIVNRAYPCLGGAFSYSISDLPNSLQNGNYYLLVGEQGSRGSWKPITSQTEITINKN